MTTTQTTLTSPIDMIDRLGNLLKQMAEWISPQAFVKIMIFTSLDVLEAVIPSILEPGVFRNMEDDQALPFASTERLRVRFGLITRSHAHVVGDQVEQPVPAPTFVGVGEELITRPDGTSYYVKPSRRRVGWILRPLGDDEHHEEASFMGFATKCLGPAPRIIPRDDTKVVEDERS